MTNLAMLMFRNLNIYQNTVYWQGIVFISVPKGVQEYSWGASVICQQASRPAPLQPATRPASEPATSPTSPQPASFRPSIWDLLPETDDSIDPKPMLHSDAVCSAMMYTKSQPSMPHLELHEQILDLLCNVTFPPLSVSTASTPRPAASTPWPKNTQVLCWRRKCWHWKNAITRSFQS